MAGGECFVRQQAAGRKEGLEKRSTALSVEGPKSIGVVRSSVMVIGRTSCTCSGLQIFGPKPGKSLQEMAGIVHHGPYGQHENTDSSQPQVPFFG